VIKENGKEGVIDITLSEKDKKIWEVIKKKIRISKLGVGESIKNKDMSKLKNSKEKHYQAIMIYDIWLRKYMQQELKLYLRESSSNPGSALFGGAFRKKT
jgi:transposase-like protein